MPKVLSAGTHLSKHPGLDRAENSQMSPLAGLGDSFLPHTSPFPSEVAPAASTRLRVSITRSRFSIWNLKSQQVSLRGFGLLVGTRGDVFFSHVPKTELVLLGPSVTRRQLINMMGSTVCLL